ncbi:MAG: hypothetical protein QW320_11980 [Ignisphaera sp.]
MLKCDLCGKEIFDEKYFLNGKVLCRECYENEKDRLSYIDFRKNKWVVE